MSGTNLTQVHMRLDKLTPGAVRYQEVGSDERPVEVKDGAKIGTLYIRKTAFPNGHFPRAILDTRLEESMKYGF